jgi:hypothetical protein
MATVVSLEPNRMAWPADIGELEAELVRVQGEIDRLYWLFSRCARAAPPVVVNAGLYTLRNAIRRKLRACRRDGKR